MLSQVAERQLADGRLTAKSLKAEVDRLTREKQDLQERAQATKVCSWDVTGQRTPRYRYLGGTGTGTGTGTSKIQVQQVLLTSANWQYKQKQEAPQLLHSTLQIAQHRLMLLYHRRDLSLRFNASLVNWTHWSASWS